MKHKKAVGMLMAAMLLTVAFVAMATPASAGSRMYAIDATKVSGHYCLVYDLEYRDYNRPKLYVGGVYMDPIKWVFVYPHSNPQEWEWQHHSPGKSRLLIPTRYVWTTPNYANSIYLQFR